MDQFYFYFSCLISLASMVKRKKKKKKPGKYTYLCFVPELRGKAFSH